MMKNMRKKGREVNMYSLSYYAEEKKIKRHEKRRAKNNLQDMIWCIRMQ